MYSYKQCTALFFLSFSLFFAVSHSLTFRSNSTHVSLSSFYSTIGSYPDATISCNYTIVWSEMVDKHNLNPEKSSRGEIKGNAIIFVGNFPISVSHLAADAEKFGATALIVKRMDNFKDGRAIAFDTPVSIPILVVPESTIDSILSFSPSEYSIEIHPISSGEKSLINRMKREVSALIIVSIVIYCILVPLFTYLFVFELIYTFRNSKYFFSHNCLMKLNALVMAILWLLWLTIDPLGMKLKPHWNGPLVCFLAGGFMLSLYLLILRILLNILSATRFSTASKTWTSRILYALAVFFIILCACFGSVWNTPTTGAIFKYFICVSVLIVGIIYAVVGKLMIDTLSGSGNVKTRPFIMRLSGFIAYYGVASVVLLATIHLHFTNDIYTTYTCAILHSVGLLVTFFLLFLRFPSQMHRRRTPTHTSSEKSLNNNKSKSDSSFSSSHSHSSSMTPSTESKDSESRDRAMSTELSFMNESATNSAQQV